MKKTIIFLALSLISFGAYAGACEDLDALDNSTVPTDPDELAAETARAQELERRCGRVSARAQSAAANAPRELSSDNLSGMDINARCRMLLTPPAPAPGGMTIAANANPAQQKMKNECQQLKKLASENRESASDPFTPVDSRETLKKTVDGAVTCVMRANYTIDYDACVAATKLYDAVFVAEKAMDMEQQVRTQLKGQKEQQEAQARAAQGDLQAAALDGQSDMQSHMKSINTEKMAAYGLAVGALFRAHSMIPGKKKALQICSTAPKEGNSQPCEETFKNHGRSILANDEAKGALQIKIAEFTAKALAAGIAMGQNQKAINAIADIKNQTPEEADDLMLERCQFNPADPACLTAGTRTPGQSFGGGEFSLGGPGGNNAFNLGAEDGEFGEEGAATNIDDSNEVASLNNPFADRAEKAKDILNPAAAAQAQATGGAGGGGAGGGGGGLGGGGASLGSDLNGADKSGDKEAQIKAGKVSGIYGQVGGGGFKGVSRGKDDANPFASLFDQKGAGGGVVEDRSIASGDIDGKASGLFQKISKRYNQISNDKRIEAKNLE